MSSNIYDLKIFKFKVTGLIKSSTIPPKARPFIIERMNSITMPVAIYGRKSTDENWLIFLSKLSNIIEDEMLRTNINSIVVADTVKRFIANAKRK